MTTAPPSNAPWVLGRKLPPLGLAYVAGALEKDGYNVQILDNYLIKKPINEVKQTVAQLESEIVGITCGSATYQRCLETARAVKEVRPSCKVVVGGWHASYAPDSLLKQPEIDYVVMGEGEQAMSELAAHIIKGGKYDDVGEIAGVGYRHNGNMIKNPPRVIEKLDQVPFPARHLLPMNLYGRKIEFLDVEPVDIMSITRGCPYNCTYCSNHALRKISRGNYTRTRTSENIISELIFIHKNFSISKIYFEIETIAAKKDWAVDLCNKIEFFNKTIDNYFSYACNFRISKISLDEELFLNFKKSNFHRINIGLESGSERVRRDILKRNYSNQEFIDAVSMARKYGLAISVYNMIGLPGESLADHMETVALNRKCQPEAHSTGIFFPYPGTELYNTCLKNGLIKKCIDNTMERKEPVLDLPEFSKSQIKQAYLWFNYRVYKGYRPYWLLLIEVIKIKVISNSASEYFYRKIVQMPILNALRVNLYHRLRKR
jgi:radical SAM superfamily enzyme YgiQ (UPF0313 family)